MADFPSYDRQDNCVDGIGCNMGYDNKYNLLYIHKKDYKLLSAFEGKVRYIGDNTFIYDNTERFLLGDERYFEDASFTISFAVDRGKFFSFHDWHPEWFVVSRGSLLTAYKGSIWKHHSRQDKYCHFYDKDYPFEVELSASSSQQVCSIRSVEYVMHTMLYDASQKGRFDILDENFDEAIVYNVEQNSGLLKLMQREKNMPLLLCQNTYNNGNYTECIWSKEEGKIRFNRFFDLQKDRMEYSKYAPVPLWIEPANGYERYLNQRAIDYKKSPLQRKKIRHHLNYV